jgi:DNA-binding NarL/FixJ family response regulator
MVDDSERLKILLADDHPVVRRGTRLIIDNEEDMLVVGEAGDGEELLTLATHLDFDMALVDVNMPKMNGIRAVQQLKKLKPLVHILMLTGFLNVGYIQASQESAVDGYLLKECSPSELITAIRMVIAGHRLFPQNDDRLTPLVAGLLSRPTGREMEILRQLSEGLSNKEIAQRLKVTERTVEFHLSNLYSKLGVSNRLEAIKKGEATGWLLA